MIIECFVDVEDYTNEETTDKISGINYTIDIPFKEFKKLWQSQ
jgi:hypothetical protein